MELLSPPCGTKGNFVLKRTKPPKIPGMLKPRGEFAPSALPGMKNLNLGGEGLSKDTQQVGSRLVSDSQPMLPAALPLEI